MSMLAPLSFPTVTYGIVVSFPVTQYSQKRSLTGEGGLRSVAPTRRLEKEPGPSLGFIDPHFNQTRRGNVAVFLTHAVRLPKTRGQLFVVLREFRDHVQGFDILRIVIEHPLSARDLA